MYSASEIERKFILTGFPTEFKLLSEYRVSQIYLSIDPEVKISALEYKDDDTVYKQTIKSDGSLSRTQLNCFLDESDYDIILSMLNKEPIVKDFKLYSMGQNRFGVSLVDNEMYYGEMKFLNKAEANAWKPSNELNKYIIKEVTCDPEHKMKNYWKRTRL